MEFLHGWEPDPHPPDSAVTGSFLAVAQGRMRRLFPSLALLLLAALPAAAQRHFELFVDAEGVHRSSRHGFSPGESDYVPQFDEGGGLGGGVNWFFSERFSVEAKIAALATRMTLVTAGSDYVATLDLGWTTMYPVSAVAQWHPLPGKGIQPYLGAGLTYVIVSDVEETVGSPEVRFGNPAGLVVAGGLRIPLGDQWVLFGDARYVPVETRGTIQFGRGTTVADMDVRPLIVAFGAGYRF